MSHTFVISESGRKENLRVISLTDITGMNFVGCFTILRCGVIHYSHIGTLEFALGMFSDGEFKQQTPRYSACSYCISPRGCDYISYWKDGKQVGILNLRTEETMIPSEF